MIVSLIDYQKLERVEVGGLMGRWYSPTIECIYHRFSKYMEKMVSISYDPLDFSNKINTTLFSEDYNFYLNMSEDFDNCLATISKACFENNNDLTSFHKVKLFKFNFDIFYILLIRTYKQYRNIVEIEPINFKI